MSLKTLSIVKRKWILSRLFYDEHLIVIYKIFTN